MWDHIEARDGSIEAPTSAQTTPPDPPPKGYTFTGHSSCARCYLMDGKGTKGTKVTMIIVVTTDCMVAMVSEIGYRPCPA